MNGAEIDQLSVADFLAYDDAASRDQLAVARGLRRLHRRARRRAARRSRDPRYRDLRRAAASALDTDRGPIDARAAIVAVSTAVLASGAIRFDPPADDHLHAASRLPLGLADKIFLSLADPDAVPPESHLLGRFDSARTGSYYLRPFGRPSSNASSAASSPASSRPRARMPPSPSSSANSVPCSAPTSPAASRRLRSLPGAASRRSSAPTATPSPDRPTPAPSWPGR